MYDVSTIQEEFVVKQTIRIAGKRSHVCSQCRGEILPGQEYLLVGKRKQHFSPDCEHATPVEPWHQRPVPDDPYWKLFQIDRPRLIRSFQRVAQKQYDCWHCNHSQNWNQQAMSPIFPGDLYDAEVYVSKYGWEIRRYHDSCPWVPDPEDLKEKDSENEESVEHKAA